MNNLVNNMDNITVSYFKYVNAIINFFQYIGYKLAIL